MADEPDPRLEDIGDEVDEIRRRLPDNPGLDVPDPDVQPIFPADENEDVYPNDDD